MDNDNDHRIYPYQYLFLSGCGLHRHIQKVVNGMDIVNDVPTVVILLVASLIIGFLPALMMSGVVFPILSMPPFFRWLTKLLPPTHYVSFIKSEFLAGTVWQNALTSSLFLLLLGFLFSLLVYKKTARRLDD